MNKKAAKIKRQIRREILLQNGKLTSTEKLITVLWEMFREQTPESANAKMLIDAYSSQGGQWRVNQYKAARRLIKNREHTS